MAIISTLMVITAAALISARDRYIVDAAAENLLLTIREAQNNSFAIKKVGTEIPTVWAVVTEDDSHEFYLKGYQPLSTPTRYLDNTYNTVTKNLNLVQINTRMTNSSGGLDSTDWAIVAFSNPFAKAYLNKYNMTGLPGTPPECVWTNYPEKPSLEYFISPTCSDTASLESLNNERVIEIVLSYKNHQAKVIINTTGDARIE